MLPQKLSIFTLGVADIGRSRKFYVETLGWTPQNEGSDIVFFDLGGAVLALYDVVACNPN